MRSRRRMPTRNAGWDAYVGWDRPAGYYWAVWDNPDTMNHPDPAVEHGDGLLTVDDLIGDSWEWIDWRAVDTKAVIITLMGDPYRHERQARPEAQALVDHALGRPPGQFQSRQAS